MIYNDPSRSVAPNGHKCWEGSQLALPTLDLIPNKESSYLHDHDPDEGTTWLALLIIPSATGGWEHVETEVIWHNLPYLLSIWRDNPEEALKIFWKRDISKAIEGYERAKQGGVMSPNPTSFISAEELGF
jgi:hypothetical protein